MFFFLSAHSSGMAYIRVAILGIWDQNIVNNQAPSLLLYVLRDPMAQREAALMVEAPLPFSMLGARFVCIRLHS